MSRLDLNLKPVAQDQQESSVRSSSKNSSIILKPQPELEKEIMNSMEDEARSQTSNKGSVRSKASEVVEHAMMNV